jgi:drug/metabolite transporter (DMT)-like permease
MQRLPATEHHPPAEESRRKTKAPSAVRPYAWMLLGSLSFALMGTMAHALGQHLDWQVVALARAGLPLLFATVLAVAGGDRLVLWQPRVLWLRSIAGSLSMMGTFYALSRLPASDVFTLTNMFPIWIALLSWPLLRKAPSAGVWLAVASGVAGVALIQQPHFAAGNFACLVALACSLATALAMIGLHRLRDLDTWAIVAHFSGVALVLGVACFFVFGRATPARDVFQPQPLLLLLGIGVTATVGQLFLTKAFAAGPPAKVSVVSLAQIVFVMALERLLFGHTFSPATLLGIALVVAPTAWVMARRG